MKWILFFPLRQDSAVERAPSTEYASSSRYQVSSGHRRASGPNASRTSPRTWEVNKPILWWSSVLILKVFSVSVQTPSPALQTFPWVPEDTSCQEHIYSQLDALKRTAPERSPSPGPGCTSCSARCWGGGTCLEQVICSHWRTQKSRTVCLRPWTRSRSSPARRWVDGADTHSLCLSENQQVVWQLYSLFIVFFVFFNHRIFNFCLLPPRRRLSGLLDQRQWPGGGGDLHHPHHHGHQGDGLHPAAQHGAGGPLGVVSGAQPHPAGRQRRGHAARQDSLWHHQLYPTGRHTHTHTQQQNRWASS